MCIRDRAEGNELINEQIEKQIKGQTQTALLQNSIATAFNQIHKWEKQYNSYLKTVSGYASSPVSYTHLDVYKRQGYNRV